MKDQVLGYIIHETYKAFLFQAHSWEEPDWVPKSQSGIERHWDTMEVTLHLSAWYVSVSGISEESEWLHEGIRTAKKAD